MPNRLAQSTSPYLQQHADNPVDWREWGEDAFAEARERDVPILLSVGYAACHWCHVMAHESFEDDATAALMNANFVNVKVDREERPDVDAVYMEVTQSLTGHGGWPMTVFMTAEGDPFYAGTYYPPEPRHGMPSFAQLLGAITESWRDKREQVRDAASGITAQLAERNAVGAAGAAPPTADQLDEAAAVLAGELDQARGGFGGAPKFPPSMALEFLLRHHARTGSTDSRATVGLTCERMARGGIYDQLGGGFARYSVDAAWVVPHFEKMLYDNALLLRVYLHWWRSEPTDFAARVVTETADFLLRELRTPEGGFASSLDADTEGHEGRFYAWTPEQLDDVLGEEDGRWAAEVFGVTRAGTFEEGASVLQLLADVAPTDASRLADVRERLFEAREQRTRPGRDDKVVAAWNGLAVAALAEAGVLLGRDDWLEAAVAAGDLLVAVHLDGEQLRRVSRDGVVGSHRGVLEDYADVAEGFLALYAATGEVPWLTFAGVLLDGVLDRFADGQGAFYDTASDAEALIRRPQDPTDNATPSGHSAAAGALLTYAAYTGSERHRSAAEAALGVIAGFGVRHPRFAGWGLAAAEALVDGPREVAVVGAADDPARAALHRTALLGTAPGAAVALGVPSDGEAEVALLRGRPLVGGRATAYVCRHFTCNAPVTDAPALAQQLT